MKEIALLYIMATWDVSHTLNTMHSYLNQNTIHQGLYVILNTKHFTQFTIAQVLTTLQGVHVTWLRCLIRFVPLGTVKEKCQLYRVPSLKSFYITLKTFIEVFLKQI